MASCSKEVVPTLSLNSKGVLLPSKKGWFICSGSAGVYFTDTSTKEVVMAVSDTSIIKINLK